MVQKSKKMTIQEFEFICSPLDPLNRYERELYAKMMKRKDEP